MKNNRPIEYKMSRAMFNSLVDSRKGDEKKLNPYVFVANFLNERGGLRDEVKRIIIEDN